VQSPDDRHVDRRVDDQPAEPIPPPTIPNPSPSPTSVNLESDPDRLDDGDDGDDDSRAMGKAKVPSRTEALFKLAEAATYFHTPEKKAYAIIKVPVPGSPGDLRFEHHPVRSKDFKQWLNCHHFQTQGTGTSKEAMENVLNTLEARANFAGAEEAIHIRVAGAEGPEGSTYYLDLKDDFGRAVRITAQGWEVVNDLPVRFRRTNSMQSLPIPERGGSIEDLRPFVNVRSDSDEDWHLLVAVICTYFRSTGPYPVLALQGEQGSAKSTTARVVSRLVDPTGFLRSSPRDGHDLAIAANNSWVVTFDNLSGLSLWLSDALCRLATGGAFATREKYSDDEETIFKAERPIVLNGIDNIAERPDLVSRSVVLNLPRIDGTMRRTEGAFWKQFDAAAPKILGAFLDALSGALALLPGVLLEHSPRMADFAHFGEALGRFLGWGEGTFSDDFDQNQDTANVSALDACPVASTIRKLLDGQPEWMGTATQLLGSLGKLADESTTRSKDWPMKPNLLSNKLTRIAPALRADGIEVTNGTTGKQRSITIRRITLEFKGESSSTSSTPASNEGKAVEVNGLRHDDPQDEESSATVVDIPSSASGSGSIEERGPRDGDSNDGDDVSKPTADGQSPSTVEDAPSSADDPRDNEEDDPWGEDENPVLPLRMDFESYMSRHHKRSERAG
jgi:hypothetical protein